MSEEKFGPFARGGKNEAYAQYFVGQSYLNMLTTTGVVTANVTFEPACRNNWHIHHKDGQILLVTPAAVTIRNGEKKLVNCTRATSSIFRLKSNTGTVLHATAGLPTLPLKFLLKALKTNGVNR